MLRPLRDICTNTSDYLLCTVRRERRVSSQGRVDPNQDR